jgi:hypothetical protein
VQKLSELDTLVGKSRKPKEPWERATCLTTADAWLERKESSWLSQNGLLQLLSSHKNITIFDASVRDLSQS